MQVAVDMTPILLREKKISSVWDNNGWNIYWEGLVFAEGTPSGEKSLRVFVNEMQKSGIDNAVNLLKGIFFIVIEEKSMGDYYAFTDNAGLYHAFCTKNAISNSFLELVKKERLKTEDLDCESVVEFLNFGNLFSGKTFFGAVSKFPCDRIFRYSGREGKVYIIPKKLLDLKIPPDMKRASLRDYFEGLAVSLRNQRVSVDLTGGIDSRLIVLMLKHCGLEFETAISGGTSDFTDVLIAKDIAHSLGIPFHSTIQSVSSMDDDMKEVFLATEGLYDPLYYHRLFQFQKERIARGVTTMISGVGGELLKDYLWIQDFPFYSRRSSNIDRLVNTRIMSFAAVSGIFTERYAKAAGSLRERIVKELAHFVLDSNTRTYDNIYFNFLARWTAGSIFTAHSHFLACCAPYLDLDVARMGFSLQRRQRFFNWFHREAITKLHPTIARLRTTEGGISCSSDPKFIFRDLPKYLSNKAQRLLIKLSLRKPQETSRNNPDLYRRARDMKAMKEAVEVLKEIKILNSRVELKKIEDRSLGPVLSLGMFVKHIKESSEKASGRERLS